MVLHSDQLVGEGVLLVVEDFHGSQAASGADVRGEAAANDNSETNVAPDPRMNDEEGILGKRMTVSWTLTISYTIAIERSITERCSVHFMYLPFQNPSSPMKLSL